MRNLLFTIACGLIGMAVFPRTINELLPALFEGTYWPLWMGFCLGCGFGPLIGHNSPQSVILNQAMAGSVILPFAIYVMTTGQASGGIWSVAVGFAAGFGGAYSSFRKRSRPETHPEIKESSLPHP